MGSPAVLVDVRDMQCAQALAQVSAAMKRLASQAALEVICNASDVEHDVLVWAKERGHVVVRTDRQAEDAHLWIQKGHMRPRLTERSDRKSEGRM